MEKHKTEILSGEKTALDVMREKGTINDRSKADKNKLGLTQQQIADRSGVTFATVANFFSADSKAPSFYNACAICAVTHTSIDEYLGLNPMYDDRVVERLDHQKELTELHKQSALHWKRGTMVMTIIAATLFLLSLTYLLVFDIPNPAFGIFRG